MKKFKKSMSLLLAVVLLAPFVPQTVFAEDTWGAPSDNVWTTDLSDFNLNAPSDGGNYKKLQFGTAQKFTLVDSTYKVTDGGASLDIPIKVSSPIPDSYAPVNWYIAKADSNSVDLLAYELDGESVSLYSPFGTFAFNSDKNEKDWDSSYGSYIDRTMNAGADKVYPNHYGSSTIRDYLNDKLLDSFTNAEQEMMKKTEITIADYKNVADGAAAPGDPAAYPSHYTVNDKLYLPTGYSQGVDPDNYTSIFLGFDSNVKVPLNAGSNHPYGESNKPWFWVTWPVYPGSALFYQQVSKATPGTGIDVFAVDTPQGGVCPACCLQLTSDLFFSSAPATITDTATGGSLSSSDSEAFVIRHKETDSTALADASVKFSADKIEATAGTSAPATLVVVWNDGMTDYYYEQVIDMGRSVEVSTFDIAFFAGCTAGELSEDCKVWLEYTDSASNFTYAKLGTFNNTTDISDATISACNFPVYNDGKPIDPEDFEITVTLDNGEDLSSDAYTLSFYSDPVCTPGEELEAITDAGVYYGLATGLESAGYTGKTTPIMVKVYKANLPKPVAVPDTIKYNGKEQTGVLLPDGADAANYIISGSTATEVGVYMAQVALANPNNYCWSGENGNPENTDTSKPFTIDWSISRDSFSYKIIAGENQKIGENADSALFKSDADYSKFVRVEVDGDSIDKEYYEVKSGSTVVTLKKSYISTLKVGEHKLTIVSSDGSASTKFTICSVSPAPDTGNSINPVLWSMIGSLSTMVICLIFRKKDLKY